jgi:hypothetical protein
MLIQISATELAPAVLAAGLVVMGASLLLQAPRWLKLLRGILEKPERYFLGAMVEMIAGLVLALSYNRWDSTWPAFTTILGWLMALESAIFLLAPNLFQGFNRLSDTFIVRYARMGGIILLVLGVLLGRFALAS